MDSKNIEEVVCEKYSRIASQSENSGCCCSCGCGNDEPTTDYTVFSESYNSLKGYNPDANLGLGCGLPTQFAQIKKGDSVIDSGSGAATAAFWPVPKRVRRGKLLASISPTK